MQTIETDSLSIIGASFFKRLQIVLLPTFATLVLNIEDADLPDEFFQKELTEIDRLIIQKEKFKKEMKPIIVGYQQ